MRRVSDICRVGQSWRAFGLSFVAQAVIACGAPDVPDGDSDPTSVEASEMPHTQLISDSEVRVHGSYYVVTFKGDGAAMAVGVLAAMDRELPIDQAPSPYEFYLGVGGDPDMAPEFLRASEQDPVLHASGVGNLYDVICGISADGQWFDNLWQSLIAVWGYEPFHWYLSSTSKNRVAAPTRTTTYYQGHLCSEHAFHGVTGKTIGHYTIGLSPTWTLLTQVPVGYRSVHTMTDPQGAPMTTRKEPTPHVEVNKWQLGVVSRN